MRCGNVESDMNSRGSCDVAHEVYPPSGEFTYGRIFVTTHGTSWIRHDIAMPMRDESCRLYLREFCEIVGEVSASDLFLKVGLLFGF